MDDVQSTQKDCTDLWFTAKAQAFWKRAFSQPLSIAKMVCKLVLLALLHFCGSVGSAQDLRCVDNRTTHCADNNNAIRSESAQRAHLNPSSIRPKDDFLEFALPLDHQPCVPIILEYPAPQRHNNTSPKPLQSKSSLKIRAEDVQYTHSVASEQGH